MQISRRELLLGALVVAAGCSRDSTSSTPNDRPLVSVPQLSVPEVVPQPKLTISSVGMVGDSITKRSTDALTYVFNAQGITDVVINAEVSRRIEVGNGRNEPLNGETTLANMLAEGIDPSVWVIALGTNDVGQYSQEEYEPLIDSMLAKPPTDKPVVWVDVYRPSALDATRQFNDLLREKAGQRDHTTVASWYDLASDAGNKLLVSDKIHPNEAGEAAFAVLVAGAVAAID